MNFLAHIYLSGNNEDIRLGNFFGDWVKGKKDKWNTKYTEDIKQGIIIHRFIDDFTDRHEIVKKSASLFSEKYRHYSKVITDIIYDHFLAHNWHLFSDIELEKYAYDFYRLLISKFFILPIQVKIFLPYLIASNRLVSYNNIEGIRKTLEIMSKNTSLPNHTEFAIDVLNQHYDELRNDSIKYINLIISEISKIYNLKIKATV